MLVLLLTAVLLVLGLGLLSERSSQYRATMQAGQSAMAEALAEAGLEDARVKLDKDADFPPLGAEDQLLFSYSETVNNLSGQPVGSYEVQVDLRWRRPPWEIVRVTSTGTVGSVDNPLSQSSTTMEIDVAPWKRPTDPPVPGPPVANPDYFKVISRE
jgi:Tfp pilus assembly protein PilX